MNDPSRKNLADALSSMTGGNGDAHDAVMSSVDNDDAVIAPAPDQSVFAPRRQARQSIEDKQLEHKRTMIPVLLTCGVMLPAIGMLKWLAGEESIFAAWGLWIPMILDFFGILFLMIAAINIWQVHEAIRGRDGD